MAKETGYTLYTCDRCNASAYLKDKDSAVSDYTVVHYLRQNGTQAELTLDNRCYQQWLTQQSRRDYLFDKWLAWGASNNKETEANKATADRAAKYESMDPTAGK